MGIGYLGNLRWNAISREERLFCAHLYFDIRRIGVPQFLRLLTQFDSGPTRFENRFSELPADNGEWDVGYEVCLYRDLPKSFEEHGLLPKKASGRIREINAGMKVEGKEPLPEKRTFDICLFSKSHIVIVEAKAQQGLDVEQCEDFLSDGQRIHELLAYLGVKQKELPKVSLIVLASSKYYASPRAGSTGNGAQKSVLTRLMDGTIELDDIAKPTELLGFIAWEQMHKRLSDPIYHSADKVYRR